MGRGNTARWGFGRKRGKGVLLAITLGFGLDLIITHGWGQTMLTTNLSPLADACVQDGKYASSNYGTVTPLQLHTASQGNEDAYLKFALGSVSNIASARLRIYAAASKSDSALFTSAYAVSNSSWTETGITWNNRPALGSALSSVAVPNQSYAWLELPITAYVQAQTAAGNKMISLGLHNSKTSKTPLVNVSSREAVSNGPVLVISYTNNLAPVVNLVSPANNSSYLVDLRVTITANASDPNPNGGITQVEFFDGATRVAQIQSSPYTFSWVPATPGAHRLTARATDNLGLSTTSTPVTITLTDADSDYDGRNNSQELADGTDPFDPTSVRPVQLGSWMFNDPFFIGDQGQLPLYTNGVSLVPSWSGNAVQVPFQAVCSGLVYRDVETNGSANVNCRNGTVRFWFKPNWNSTFNGVTGGPRTYAVFLDMGAVGQTGGLWALGSNPDGTVLAFATMTNQTYTYYFTASDLTASIHWLSNHWYQITLAYSPSNTSVYINASLAASGPGIQSYPSANMRANGFRIGMDWSCGSSPNGQFAALETFNYPLDARAVARSFPNFQNSSQVIDSDYDGRSDFLESLVDGTAPNNPAEVVPARLGYWRFNDPSWVGEQGQMPLLASGVRAVPGWSGTAMEAPLQGTGPGTTYREYETNGWANINCRNGTVRFWFRPNWNSTANGITGGPRTGGSLIEVGGYNLNAGWWALSLNPDGTNLTFATMANQNYTYYFSPAISWTSNQWYQIALTYSPTQTALYVNGGLMGMGIGIQSLPDSSMRTNGFRLGWDWYGGQSPGGAFDELETFNYSLNAAQIAQGFQAAQDMDVDLDGAPGLVTESILTQSAPFSATPFVVTGAIEAECFDQGGPNVAYYSQVDHQTTDYRPTRLSIEPCTDLGGGYCVSQLGAGDWLQYTFVVRAAGNYTFDVRAAADSPGGQFLMQFGQANGVAQYQTAPVRLTQTGWQTVIIDNIALLPGTNIFRLVMQANAANGFVGKLNYISIYPTVSPYLPQPSGLFLDVTKPPYNAIGDGNSSNAQSNRMAFQMALNDLQNNPAGGTLFVPAGTFVIGKDPATNPGEEPGKSPRENSALRLGRPFLDPGPVANIELRGDTAGESILEAYDRTTTILFVRRMCCISSSVIYSNFFFNRITFKGRPHIRPDGSYDPGTFNNYSTISTTPGIASLLVLNTDDWNAPITGVNISNCRFLNSDGNDIVVWGVKNMAVTGCQFSYWDGEPLPVASTNQHNATNGLPCNQVGFFGAGYNFVVLSNSFNGNPALSSPQGYASDGFVWFLSGGNWFVGRNTIRNYGLEGVAFFAGPAAATGNQYVTTQQNGSTAALCAFALWPGLNGTVDQDAYFYLVGNDIQGGREAFRGNFDGQTAQNASYNLHVCGNTVTLAPPVLDGSMVDCPSSLVFANNCRRAFVAGNTLRASDYGFRAGLIHASAEFLKNDFRNAGQCSILYERPAGTIESIVIAKNLLNCGRYVPPPGWWVITGGSGCHVKLPYEDASKFFLSGNTFLNVTGNPTGLVLDPPLAPVNIAP